MPKLNGKSEWATWSDKYADRGLEAVVRICADPTCHGRFRRHLSRGRKQIYCSSQCAHRMAIRAAAMRRHLW